MNHLDKHYENIKTVNLGIINRIRSVVKKDADLNAIVILKSFANLLTMAIAENLSDLENLFQFNKKN